MDHALRLCSAATTEGARVHYAEVYQRQQFAAASARGDQWVMDTQGRIEHQTNLYRLAGYYR